MEKEWGDGSFFEGETFVRFLGALFDFSKTHIWSSGALLDRFLITNSAKVLNFQPTRQELGRSSGLRGSFVLSSTPVTTSPRLKEPQGMSSQ